MCTLYALRARPTERLSKWWTLYWRTLSSIAALPLLDLTTDEMGLNASVVGQLQDLVIDSEDVSGFLEDLAVFTAETGLACKR
ncbi:hypothetical protein AB4Z38_13075 [Arthrobacter sp. 2RAF6]|uniref:hypothetical protein n=1 Tax=Arthrobacter sp. 2RAF6 TaxID=3233002 RepID=UPI003F90ECFA